MADAGNLTLAYAADAVNVINAKCTKFGYSFEVVATESHAREHRAMYPHQRSLGRFFAEVKFMNYGEYRTFMNFLRAYAKNWLHPPANKPYLASGINVILSRGAYQEVRIGVPVGGITDGDHVGNIGYTSRITFQTISDPLDPTMFIGNDPAVSQPVMGDDYTEADAADDTTRFFYPFSPGSEDIRVQATDIYGLGGGGAAPVLPPTPGNPTGGGFNPVPPGGTIPGAPGAPPIVIPGLG